MRSLELQPLEPRICMSLSFAPPVGSPVGGVSEMAAGDFNSDGIADLAVWDASNSPFAAVPTVRILAGEGNGKFKEIARAYAGPNITDLEAADLNRDGKLDLIAANSANTNGYGTVTVLPGKGDGTFGGPNSSAADAVRSYFVGANTRDIAVGDFDNNGIPDILAANLDAWSPNPASDMPSRFGAGLLLGSGYGSFQRVMMIPLIDGQTHVVTGDVDKDGRLDAVLGGPFSMSASPVERALIHVVLNRRANATSTATPFVVTQFSPFVGKVAGLALNDLNADGLADLAAVQDYPTNSNGSTATLHTMLSKGDGTFAPKSAVNAQVFRPAGLSVGDLDRDGLLDFVITGTDPRPVIAIWPPPGLASVMLGTGGGAVAAPHLFYSGPASATQRLADLNNDGRLDLITGSPSGVSAMINTSSSTTTGLSLFNRSLFR